MYNFGTKCIDCMSEQFEDPEATEVPTPGGAQESLSNQSELMENLGENISLT